jgi:hypothetical protein
MPQPFETGDKVGRMRVVERHRRGYRCRCIRCNRTSVVVGKTLRLKHSDVNCRLCFPPRRQPQSVIVYSKRGYALIEEAA